MINSYVYRSAMAVLLGSIALPAMAQSSDATTAPASPASQPGSDMRTGGAFGEIVVTARRREEESIKVPVAITAFSAERLAEQRIGTSQDLQGQVPSLTVGAVGQSRLTESFTLRGQGTSYLASPGVVNYLAEVPLVSGIYSSLQGGPGMFLDLANLQVLRGPQGTLFGRNTTGGAILLEPAKPTDKFEGYVQAQVGNYNDHEFEGVVNVPVSDTLSLRVAGRSVDRDGYTRDVVNGKDYDDRHYVSGRLGILWKPSDRADNYLMIYGSRSHGNGTGFVNSGFNPTYLNAVFAGAGGCAGVGLGTNCSVLTALGDAQRARGIRRVSLSDGLIEEASGFGFIDRFNLHLNDHLTLRNIISYGELRAKIAEDDDGTTANIFNIGPIYGDPTDRLNQFTEELQLQGEAADSKLVYAIGVYYQEGRTVGEQGLATRVLLGNGGSLRGSRQKSYAGYAQATYDFGNLSSALDGLKLTGGFRYTWDRSSGFGSIFSPGDTRVVTACRNGQNPTGPLNPMSCAIYNSYESSAPSWTIGLDYSLGQTGLIYAKVTRGYKAGGVNYSAVNPTAGNFKPEFVTSYEAGIKTRWQLGGAAGMFNINAYRLDYKDIQRAGSDFNPTTSSVGVAVFNAGAARINGVELEGAIEPFRGFRLSGSYSYTDAKYRDYHLVNPFGQVDCSGGFVAGLVNLSCVPFPYVAKNQYSINGRYEVPIGTKSSKLTMSATWSYIGRQYTAPTSLPQVEPGAYLEGYNLLNASLTWANLLDTPLDLTVFGTNLTDEVYRISNSNVYNGIGSIASVYGEPRMYGVELKYHW